MAELAQCFQFDDVEVRPSAFEVLKGGKLIQLEPKAIRVLIYLIEHRDHAVSKDELLNAVWEGAAVTDNALTRIIAQLRKELGDDARSPRYIQTIPTVGYRFVAGLAPAATVEAARPSTRHRWEKAWPALLGIVPLVTLVVALWLPDVQRNSVVSGSPVQVTTSPGLDTGPSLSPDGQSVVYSTNRTGKFEIYIRPIRPDGQESRLTFDGNQNVQPAWSPNGRWIAFHSVIQNAICVVNTRGGEIRQLTKFGSSPTWSPDGSRIAFRSSGVLSMALTDVLGQGASTIWVVPLSGGPPIQLTKAGSPQGTHVFPAWMSDSSRVLFVNANARRGEIYAVDVATHALTHLGDVPQKALSSGVFSPDGRWLYFASVNQSGQYGIWRAALDKLREPKSSAMEVLQTSNTVPREMAVSADGKHLAYSIGARISQLWTVSTDGGEPKPLYQDSVYRSTHSFFSPDGSKIAYISRRFGAHPDVWVMNADGSNPSAIAADPEQELLPTWSQDGRSVYYSKIVGSRTEVWQYSMDDARRRRIWINSKVAPWLRVMSNGTEALYHDGTPINVWRADLIKGTARQLTFDTEGAGYAAASNDGRWIALELVRGDSTVLAYTDRDGKNQTILNTGTVHAWVNDWSKDDRLLLYAGFVDGAWNIWSIDRVTGEKRKLTNYASLDTYVRYPAWSSKDDRIIYEYGGGTANIYTVELR